MSHTLLVDIEIQGKSVFLLILDINLSLFLDQPTADVIKIKS